MKSYKLLARQHTSSLRSLSTLSSKSFLAASSQFSSHNPRVNHPLCSFQTSFLRSSVSSFSAYSTVATNLKPFFAEEQDQRNLSDHSFHPAWLRDSCPGSCCVDSSSKQKRFDTTAIPPNIEVRDTAFLPDGSLEVRWTNDVKGYDSDHISVYPKSFLDTYRDDQALLLDRGHTALESPWDKATISRELAYVSYDDFMSSNESLYQALLQLRIRGLLFLKNVPSSESSIEKITDRIGRLRDTFYGRTWDVKSVPKAKNVAYTSQHLHFHMDLLYMSDPPGFQLLHCLKNSCLGGSALFSDAFKAASELPSDCFDILAKHETSYHYRNAGEHYFFRRPTIEAGLVDVGQSHGVGFVNWSPPFQANYSYTGNAQFEIIPELYRASKVFANLIEAPRNVYKHDYKEGECVVFNNRRVLHAREAFETNTGERWLKGAYVDTDVFMSRFRVLHEQQVNPAE